jgi:hypothetical protein
VQPWTGEKAYDTRSHWVRFPRGAVEGGRGGVETCRLAEAPITAQYLRIVLKTSSNTAPAGAIDAGGVVPG